MINVEEKLTAQLVFTVRKDEGNIHKPCTRLLHDDNFFDLSRYFASNCSEAALKALVSFEQLHRIYKDTFWLWRFTSPPPPTMEMKTSHQHLGLQIWVGQFCEMLFYVIFTSFYLPPNVMKTIYHQSHKVNIVTWGLEFICIDSLSTCS